MDFCPECGCQLDITKGVVMCTHCTYSECHCELCSMQDFVEVHEENSNNKNELKGETNHVEQANRK